MLAMARLKWSGEVINHRAYLFGAMEKAVGTFANESMTLLFIFQAGVYVEVAWLAHCV